MGWVGVSVFSYALEWGWGLVLLEYELEFGPQNNF